MTPGVVVCWSGYEPHIQTLRIPRDGLVFGREYTNDTDERISRQHVRIRAEGRAGHFEDLGSRNGTFINKWANPQPTSAPLPAVVRTGRTVFVVVPEIEIYEEQHEGSWGAALAQARKEIAAAARAEQNVTIETGTFDGLALARSYCDTVGGENVIYQPARDAPSLDATLAGTKPRVVVLQLARGALPRADLPTVETWLETDVRFVTAMWPGANVLWMAEQAAVARLRERVVKVVTPRYPELPFRVRDLVCRHAPNIRISATLCEGMLIMAHQLGEEWAVRRFASAVADWYATRDPEVTTLHMSNIIHEIEPPQNGVHCVAGFSGDRSF